MTTRSHAGVATTGIAVVGIAAMAATPLAPATQTQSPPAVSHDVRLTAADGPARRAHHQLPGQSGDLLLARLPGPCPDRRDARRHDAAGAGSVRYRIAIGRPVEGDRRHRRFGDRADERAAAAAIVADATLWRPGR